RPYFEQRTNIIVTRGAFGAKGRIGYGKSSTGAAVLRYAGDVTVADFASLDQPTSQELMRWGSLDLTGVDVTTDPFKLALGSVAALSAAQMGDVDVTARVENTAPIEIRGTVSPFTRELMLDLSATAKNVDLPPLTPYSTKYAGYGIQKGKLSLDVHYRIENR